MHMNFIHVQASLMKIIGIWSVPKHPWRLLLGFNSCPSVLDEYWNLIHVQASLMMITAVWSMSKHPWLCWLGFYQRPSVHNDDYCNYIHVEASYMMITVIWSMSKHLWWWLLQFNPCPSILDDVDWDFINVQAYLMMMGVWSMYKYPCWSSGFNPCLKTNFLSWWQKFGHDDNWNCHGDKNLVMRQFQLSSWPIFCHRDKNLVKRPKIKNQKERPLKILTAKWMKNIHII